MVPYQMIGAGAAATVDTIGGFIQAGAQKKIAKAQQAEAKRIQDLAMGFAAPTQAELDTLNKQISVYEQMYSRNQGLLDQASKQLSDIYGPSIMEQGKIFLKQVQGEAAGVTQMYNQQRSRMRQKLEQDLIARMGPGAVTSSAGQQALQQFDMETSEQSTVIQENALNNSLNRLGGLTGQQANLGGLINNVYNNFGAMLSQIQKTQGYFQERQIGALMGTAPATLGTAGSQYVGQLYYGQAISQGAKTFASALGGASGGGGGGVSGGPIQQQKFGDIGGGSDSGGGGEPKVVRGYSYSPTYGVVGS